VEPFFSNYPEDDNRPEECADIVRPKFQDLLLFLGGDVFPQECSDPFIVMFGRIEGADDLLVAAYQQVIVHPGDEID